MEQNLILAQESIRPKFITGSSFRKGTSILLYDGTVKNVEDIKVNDLVMGDDSFPIHITNVRQIKAEIYQISPTDTTHPFYLSEGHILCFTYNTKPCIREEKGKHPRYRVFFPDTLVDKESYDFPISRVTIRNIGFSKAKYSEEGALKRAKEEHEFLTHKYLKKFPIHNVDLIKYSNQAKNFNHRLVCYRVGIEFSYCNIQELNPYLLGVWLGDGDSSGTIITNIDKEIINFLCEIGKEMNMNVKKRKDNKDGKDSMRYAFSGKETGKGHNKFRNFLKNNNLLNNKHIPHNYKANTRENRLALLAGLIDTDGHFNETFYEIYQKNKILADDIVFLARSLGFWCHIKPVEKGCVYKSEMRKGIYQRITFGGDNLNEIPVLIPRKKAPILEKRKIVDYNHYKITITPEKDEDDCYSFETSSTNRKILMGDFTVTFI